MDSGEQTLEVTRKQLIEATVARVVRGIYLRMIARLGTLGTRILNASPDEQALALAPFRESMERDVELLMECVAQGRAEALSSVCRRLGELPGIDADRIGQAMEWAAGPKTGREG